MNSVSLAVCMSCRVLTLVNILRLWGNSYSQGRMQACATCTTAQGRQKFKGWTIFRTEKFRKCFIDGRIFLKVKQC